MAAICATETRDADAGLPQLLTVHSVRSQASDKGLDLPGQPDHASLGSPGAAGRAADNLEKGDPKLNRRHPDDPEEGATKTEWQRALCFCSERKEAIVVGVSLLLLGLFLVVDLDPERPEASKGAAVLLITALWWFTEVIPLTITSLLPMLLYPLLGVVKASTLAGKFFKGTSFLFIAGFFIGLAVERWGLHSRVVCAVVSHAGRRMETLIGGFMLSVWLLSMWISNTATILCMLPMAQAFLGSLPPGHDRFKSGFLLAVGYSATIGGIATPVGTPTNGIFMEAFATFWPNEGEFSFAHFTLCALPLSLLLLVTVWVGFCAMHIWTSQETIPIDRELFREWRRNVGKASFEEIVVASTLLVLIVLWFTASPIDSFMGWKGSVAKELNSGAIGLALTLPLFFVPCGSRLPGALRRALGEERCRSKVREGEPEPKHILDWEAVKGGFQWEILFVFGGGAMIAHGTVASGLAAWVAEQLSHLAANQFLFVFLVASVICFVTEVVSNMATLSIFGSIIAATAQMKGYDPVQLLLVVCFASSFAFMLPMAGGPNMVVYSTGRIPVACMAKHGFGLNIAAILMGTLYMALLMPLLLGDYSDLPAPSAEG